MANTMKCKKCKYSWRGQGSLCPKCKSKEITKGDEVEPVTCGKCGHSYTPRVKNPKTCPRCKNRLDKPRATPAKAQVGEGVHGA